MKPILLPLIIAGLVILFLWDQVTKIRTEEASAQTQMKSVLVQLSQKEGDLARGQADLAKQSASLNRAKTFLRLWSETYERGSILDDGVFGTFASRNGVVTQKRQQSAPALMQLPNGAQLSATKMSFATQGSFPRSLRLLGEIEEAYELANVVEARFSQQGPDLSSNFTIYYPILTFVGGSK